MALYDIDGIYIIVSAIFEPDRLKYLKHYFLNNPIDIPIHYIEPFYVGRDDKNINHQHYSRNLTKGEKMLAATYEKLFEDILKIETNNKIILFESDVIFCPNFKEKLESVVNQWIHYAKHPSIVFFGGATFSLGTKLNEKNKISEQLYIMDRTRCADSMLFDREAMKIIYLNMKMSRLINNPVDILWNYYFKIGFSGYWTKDPLTKQGSELGLYKSVVRERPMPKMPMFL